MSGKKGKKTKGKAVPLGEFLGNSATDGKTQIVVSAKNSWAEESEDFEDERYGPSERITLPTAPRQARGPAVNPEMIPNNAPYIAFVANLPFEVEEEDIRRFFTKLDINSIRIPREGGDNGRMKGYAYVEFDSKADLLEALSLNEETLRNRKIRVDLADEDNNRKNNQSNYRDRDEEREDRSGGIADWRSAPRGEGGSSSYNRSPERRSGFGDRDRDRNFGERDSRSSGGYRDDKGGDTDRSGSGSRFGSSRDYNDRRGGYDDRDRRGGGYDDRDRRGGYDRDRRDGGYERPRGGGYDRDDRRGGGFGERRGYEDRRDGGYERPRGGGYDRDDRRRDGGGYDRDRKDGDQGSSDGPKERPKLILQKRSKPVEAKTDTTSGANPSIFGAAKPVDTASKEQEMEQKINKNETRPAQVVVKREPAVAIDIFGAAKPVDTASREREIEEKIKKKMEPTLKKEDREEHGNSDNRPKKFTNERRDRPRQDRDQSERSPKEREEMNNKLNNEDSNTINGQEESTKQIESNPEKKMMTLEDETPIIDTTNKFSQLGLDEEDV